MIRFDGFQLFASIKSNKIRKLGEQMVCRYVTSIYDVLRGQRTIPQSSNTKKVNPMNDVNQNMTHFESQSSIKPQITNEPIRNQVFNKKECH